MRQRALGLETEYLVVYFPSASDSGRPAKSEIYAWLDAELAERLPSL